MAGRRHIAVDWGTTRFRAFLVDDGGMIIDRRSGPDGVSSVPAGGFAGVLDRHCAEWLKASPDIPVVMAGMAGSRNGWTEAPYALCPASVADVARSLIKTASQAARDVTIVPGLITRDGSGAPDVLRGEETLIFGAGVADGIVVLPGTHSKWARIEAGAITGFTSFMTGEFYDVLMKHSLLGRLATSPADESGFRQGLAAAKSSAGQALTASAFQARTRVLAGDIAGAAVAPFLSGLLIGSEIQSALQSFGAPKRVILVGDGVLAEAYRTALAASGVETEMRDPGACLLKGLARILAAR